MTSLNILLVAEEAAGVQTLRFLCGSPHRVVAVLTGRGDGSAATAVGTAAARAGCAVWPASLVRDAAFAETVRRHDVDLLLNVHSLFVVHQAVVAAPRIGSFNVHPGLLPGYAGLNAPSWAIYHGERAHGVTVHWMDKGIDTGRIAYQAGLEIAEGDTGYTLSAKCTRAALPLLQQLVAAAAQDPAAIPRAPQPDGPRRYFGREVPENGRIDWSAPARRVVDFVRAADYSPFESPWGHPRTWADSRELAVVRAARTGLPADAAPGVVGQPLGAAMLVASGDEWVAIQRAELNGVLVDGCTALERGLRLTVGPSELSPEV
ncbi:MAG TPA: formyltransferase family protein [Gemmatimonadales bacterium]